MGETLTKRLTTRHPGGVLAALATCAVAVAAVVLGGGTAAAAPELSAAGGTARIAATTSMVTCPTVFWGSLPKASAAQTDRPVSGVRAGRHACYDRLVIDLGSGAGTVGYHIRYVATVFSEGRGAAVPVAGGATLQVVVRAPAYGPGGSAGYRPADPHHVVAVGGFTTMRQVAYAGSFEGQTTFAVGVRARLPMRAFVVLGPGSGQRLVIDVAHRW